jgi:hypothetical protein
VNIKFPNSKQASTLCVALILILVSKLPVKAAPQQASYKLQTSYSIPKKTQNLKLRVLEIPKEFDWIDRDLDGKTVLPTKNSIIVFETIENIAVSKSDGMVNYLPAGTKFWAKLNSVSDPKSFHRDGKINLDFFQAQTPAKSKVELANISYDSSSNPVSQSGSALLSVGAYALGGALAAPLITFSITGSKLLGISMLSNPYVLAGTSALGGAAGIIYGIKKKGSQSVLEPGTEIELSLKENWKFDEVVVNNLEQNPITLNKNFNFNILKISKTTDIFDDKAIKILVEYENFLSEKLFYNNFVLLDSMGKEYYPSNQRNQDYSLEGLPRKGTLELIYASDFLKAIHKLQVRKTYNQELITEQKIILK